MSRSIKYFFDKIKLIENSLQNKDIFVVLIIILTGFASFGLGRLSKKEENKTPIKIDFVTEKSITRKPYVAAKNGSVYYFTWCKGAQKIKNENKIRFNTKKQAESRGYKPAKNCKGL